MLDRIEELADLLRANGVRVSTAEVIDAARAARAVGLARRQPLRAALAASLVKRSSDRRTFDQLFELLFSRGAALARGAGADLAQLLADAGLDDDAIAELLARMAREAAAISGVARVGLGIGAPEISSLVRAAGAEVDLDRIRSPLQVGFYSYRMLEALDVDGAAAALRQLIDQMRADGAIDQAQADRLLELTADNLAALRRAVRDYVDGEFRRHNLDFMQELATRALSDKPLGQLTDDEVDSLRREVQRLARVLRARVSLKPVVKRRGRLDLRRTLRRSLATGGVPFELIRRERERRKPRLVILCDVSDSVRNVSRFMLQLVYALQELFDRVDSFAFVAELGQLTELFRTYDIDRALELTYSGAVVNVFANSNYGRALAQFADRHLDRVTPRTTVLILGDGRNNYHPARASLLGDLRRRAKQVWWLNPESPAAWGFGDSAMHEYEPHCDRVEVVYNLRSLERVVDELVV
jgi:uncharacterized protein with von Willebrand factor type A (vWA) domain